LVWLSRFGLSSSRKVLAIETADSEWTIPQLTLGWHEQDVHVIDVDLGRSGATLDGRYSQQGPAW
jgi:hypothetical protein